MDIYRAERVAQDRAMDPGWDKSFKLVGPLNEVECEWLDPYFGIFTIKGREGFVMLKQIPEGFEIVMPEVAPPTRSDAAE
jgi:hypothetical protein